MDKEIELSRDSVCMGDDIESHEKIISIHYIIDTVEFISKMSYGYLPFIAGKNHKWECIFNDELIGTILGNNTEIQPIVPQIKYKEKNEMYFKYYSAVD